MKVESDFITKLIEEKNPVPIVGDKLLNLWLDAAHREKDTRGYYYNGESEAKAFEEFILRSYNEFYLLLAKTCLNEKTPFQRYSDATFLVMDGMSFRESALLYRDLKEEGFDVAHTFAYSMVPSDTEIFREKIGIPMSKFVQISKPDKIRFPADANYIWSNFPDVMLNKIQVGKVVISSLEDMYKTVKNIVFEIISRAESSKIIILSDHGYIRTEAGFVFSVSDRAKRKLQEILGSKRYLKMDSIDLKDLIEEGYIEEFNGYYLVKSRYLWPVPGKYSIYIHGGLSLMECFTPVIEVRK